MIHNFIAWWSRMRTWQLIALPLAVSLLPLGVFVLVGGGRYTGASVQDCAVFAMLLLWGLVGLPLAIRGRGHARLVWLAGLLIMACFWCTAAYAMIGVLGKVLQ